MKLPKKKETLIIEPIQMRTVSFCLVGTSPFIMHRFALKAWQELLYPSGRKNAAERAQNLKHNPLEEFRWALYRNRNRKAATLFHIPNGMIHQSIAAAALDLPGATRASLERLTSVVNPNIDLYGLPRMLFSMVRNSDINRTPDVRMRPVFPRWAAQVQIQYKLDPLTDTQIANLLGAAGMIVGIGDWRPQKGGTYGKFRVASANDHEYQEILKQEARKAQQNAWDKPQEFDEDTADLMSWYNAEVARRRPAAEEEAA